MKTYLDCWITTATALFAQALTGEPELIQCDRNDYELSGCGFVAELEGDGAGSFSVVLDSGIVAAPLHGDGVEQLSAWREFLREVAEAAAGELLASTGLNCRITSFKPAQPTGKATHAFQLRAGENSWLVQVIDEVKSRSQEPLQQETKDIEEGAVEMRRELPRGVELLLDVELEATLRFGCREMPLGEILELGPGDVVELDRHVSDPVDLVVGDKIVARGDVVLVNGNFGLRITDVAEPQKRLESVRCLF